VIGASTVRNNNFINHFHIFHLTSLNKYHNLVWKGMWVRSIDMGDMKS